MSRAPYPGRLLVLLGLALTARAAAHAPPQVLEVLEAPDMSRIVLVTNRGLLLGTRFLPEPDFRMMCSLALGIGTAERPEVVILGDGTLVAASTMGIQTSRDGCVWDSAPAFEGQNASALAQDPSARDTLYIATFTGTAGALHVSRDGGKTFEKLGDAEDFVHQLVPAPSRVEQIYSVRQGATAADYYLSVSQDSGATWETRAAPLLSSEGGLEVLAVSPVDPELLLAKGLDNDPMRLLDRVLVSRDGGRTFESPLSVKQLFDATFSADGQKVWLAGIEGVQRSDDVAASFAPLPGATRMSCVHGRADDLVGCGFYADMKDGIGVSGDDGASFRMLLEFTSITEPIACAEDTPTARACEVLWADWQREILGVRDGGAPSPVADSGASTDAAAADAGSEDAGRRARRKSSGCSALPTCAQPEGFALLSALVLVLLARRSNAAGRGGLRAPRAQAARAPERSSSRYALARRPGTSSPSRMRIARRHRP